MRFSAMKSDLQSAAAIASRAVPSHTTMSILECILIRARGQSLIFTANDMEMGIETRITANVEEQGMIAVEAKMFSEIMRKLPDDMVRFETDENLGIRIRCGKARFSIGGRSGEEFTDFPEIETYDSVDISGYTLKSLIQNTIFSIAAGDNSKIMSGELFEVRGGILRVVALDGHRIALRKEVLGGDPSDRKVIIPGKTLMDISRIISGNIDELVRLHYSGNHIVFELPDTRIVSRLISGEYFDVDHMISTDYGTKITVNRSELIGCIERASLFVRESDKKPIVFEIGEKEMNISINTPLGSMNESVDISMDGREMVIGFNPRFVMEVLKAIDDEEVDMYMINPKAPCFIRNADDTYMYLVLPVNMKDI
ncbi:MAG: DNA polymerase III subunit beta [Lachnospiraceae bacterium]|nr:DNA polymerase III subunit beta [Lachnospiraceae bacterium]